jgi:hypothetical protein
MSAGNEPPAILTYQGTRYRLHEGRIVLNWEKPARPVLHHWKGCLLCCEVRVARRPGAPPRHPDNCGNCGPRYRGPRPDLCQHCGKTAHFLDDHGRPTHKACLELVITTEALRGAVVLTSPLTLDHWKEAA